MGVIDLDARVSNLEENGGGVSPYALIETTSTQDAVDITGYTDLYIEASHDNYYGVITINVPCTTTGKNIAISCGGYTITVTLGTNTINKSSSIGSISVYGR